MGDAGQSPHWVFPALRRRLAAPSGLGPSGDLTSPPAAPLGAALSGEAGWEVQLLLLPATGARYRGIKGFVLVGKLRHGKGTGASQRQGSGLSAVTPTQAFCPPGRAAPRTAGAGVDFPFKQNSLVQSTKHLVCHDFLHRSRAWPGVSAPLLAGRGGRAPVMPLSSRPLARRL